MLGDVDPDQLAVIAAGRDLIKANQANVVQQGLADAGLADAPKPEDWKTVKIEGKGSGPMQEIDPDTVLHAIQQEIDRLRAFAKAPPPSARTEQVKTQPPTPVEQGSDLDKAAKIGGGGDATATISGGSGVAKDEQRWDVRLVEVPLSDGSKAVLTYGEVNTLADFFGSTDQIRQTDAEQFRAYLNGIREESIRKFMRLYNEVAAGTGRTPEYDADADEHTVKTKGAGGQTITSMGNTGKTGKVGTLVGGDAAAELRMMGKTPLGGEERAKLKDAKGNVKEETSYTAGLGRNACHFAPQSWHAWAEQHNKAVALANEAYALRQQYADRSLPESNAKHAEADEKQNKAMFENGFGDHFLQDSYAAGHLINKTLIMQWFVKWNDQNGDRRNYTSNEDWRSVQNIAYGQEGIAGKELYTKEIGASQSNDPQSVENMAGSWQGRFDALGLKVPGSLANRDSDTAKIFRWWQERSASDASKASLTSADLIKGGPVKGETKVVEALNALLNDGVIYYGNYSTKDRAKITKDETSGKLTNTIGFSGALPFMGGKPLMLKKEYIPDPVSWRSMMRKESRAIAGASKAQSEGDPSAPERLKNADAPYQDKAKSATYGDYHKFLNHGYIQLATNVLHDYFCKNGLVVNDMAGNMGYKIYGDNNMLQEESSKGVKISAETSNKSRDSIVDLATTGRTDKTTKAISDRFPRSVTTVKDGTPLTLENWHADNGPLHKLCWDVVFPKQVAGGLFSKSTVAASDKLADKISADVGAGEAF